MATMMVRDDSEHQHSRGTQWTANPDKDPLASKDHPVQTTLRMLTVAWLLVILLLLPALTRGETAVQAWVQRYNGPGNGYAAGNAVAVDGSNNIIVTGYSTGSGSGQDYATIKYSSAGVPLWTNLYNGPGNDDDHAVAVAVDGSANVVVTGYSTGSGSGCDYATIKYSSAGVPLWTNRYNGPGNAGDSAEAVAVDHSGNVIVTGYSTGSGGESDFATIKYICVPSPVMTGLQLTNGTLQMEVDDVLQPGTLVIEACTDLAGWVPVFTNTTPTNVLFYTYPDAGPYPGRFYRAYQSP
jgi:hypothetical protein